MPIVSADIWNILYTVARYLLPLLILSIVFLILFYILSESRNRREKIHNLPGSGTVGELVVLSGSRDLDVNTWFPVPREGVLGSVRSCDLVIPCPGVHTKHLDFSWEDGTGLLIRPHTGCEVQINGIPVTCRTRTTDVPLTHGSVLQVGSAILRLHLFAALDNTAAAMHPPQAEPPVFPQAPVYLPFSSQSSELMSPAQVDFFAAPPDFAGPSSAENPVQPEAPAAPENVSGHPRRSDRWKEDFGE